LIVPVRDVDDERDGICREAALIVFVLAMPE
jgi:hypothetical protein